MSNKRAGFSVIGISSEYNKLAHRDRSAYNVLCIYLTKALSNLDCVDWNKWFLVVCPITPSMFRNAPRVFSFSVLGIKKKEEWVILTRYIFEPLSTRKTVILIDGKDLVNNLLDSFVENVMMFYWSFLKRFIVNRVSKFLFQISFSMDKFYEEFDIRKMLKLI